MFRDLPWRSGFRKAAIFIVIWAALIYVMNTAFPETFGLTSEELPGFALNAVMFFFIFALFFSWTEKRRRERMEELKNRKKDGRTKAAAGGDEDRPDSPLKGQLNPNTSRKKARRRR